MSWNDPVVPMDKQTRKIYNLAKSIPNTPEGTTARHILSKRGILLDKIGIDWSDARVDWYNPRTERKYQSPRSVQMMYFGFLLTGKQLKKVSN